METDELGALSNITIRRGIVMGRFSEFKNNKVV